MSLPFLQYDVFTDQALAGNQLAVFLDGRALSTERMQAIAREMNFSESTFILPPEAAGTDVRMRIFTPANELPMAGDSRPIPSCRLWPARRDPGRGLRRRLFAAESVCPTGAPRATAGAGDPL